MIDIMLDLETWGKKPGCDIRSIGACVFDYKTGCNVKPYFEFDPNSDYKSFYVACDNHLIKNAKRLNVRRYSLKRDPETVAWWNDQSPEAQAAFTNPIDLKQALKAFSNFIAINTDKNPYRIWAHGPQFDTTILAAAYDAVGLPVPWHYRAPRDTRTAFDLAGIEDHSGFMGMFNTGTHHHALDDAICQAKAVCAAYKVLRSGSIGAIE